jgi:hypothetical protein
VNAQDVLRYGQGDVDRLIDRFTADDWSSIALGTWTTKDLVGHLGAFEVRFREALIALLGDPPPTDLRSSPPATFNDDQAAIRRDWSVDAIVDELQGAHRGIMELLDRLPADRWREVGTIPWYGPQYSLDDLAVYQMYGHKREHCPQLQAVLERRSEPDH